MAAVCIGGRDTLQQQQSVLATSCTWHHCGTCGQCLLLPLLHTFLITLVQSCVLHLMSAADLQGEYHALTDAIKVLKSQMTAGIIIDMTVSDRAQSAMSLTARI